MEYQIQPQKIRDKKPIGPKYLSKVQQFQIESYLCTTDNSQSIPSSPLL